MSSERLHTPPPAVMVAVGNHPVTRAEINQALSYLVTREEYVGLAGHVSHLTKAMAERGIATREDMDGVRAEVLELKVTAQRAEVAGARSAERLAALRRTLKWVAGIGATIFAGATVAMIQAILSVRAGH